MTEFVEQPLASPGMLYRKCYNFPVSQYLEETVVKAVGYQGQRMGGSLTPLLAGWNLQGQTRVTQQERLSWTREGGFGNNRFYFLLKSSVVCK